MENELALEEFVHKDYVQILEKENYMLHQIIKNMNIELQQNKGQGYRKVQEQQKNWKRIDVNDLFQKNTKTISNINKLSVDELKKMQ